MTRTDLETAIYAWLHRANFRSPVPNFDAVPTFIALAEQDINMDLRARCMIHRSTQVVDGQYLTLPCDYIEMEDTRLVGGGEMVYRSRAELANYRMRGFDVQGGPTSFTIVGDLMEVWPVPGPPQNQPEGWTPPTLEMAYYARQTLGPDDTDTTDVLSQYPATYLYGALSQSAPFLRNDERLATWQGAYQQAIIKANTESDRARSQGSRIVARFRGVG